VQSGVLRVDTLGELFDYAIAFAYQPIPRGDGTVVVSNAGGPAIIVADAALSRLSEKTTEELKNASKNSIPSQSN
jgi:acetate---CoA ligase (ADP-forming)